MERAGPVGGVGAVGPRPFRPLQRFPENPQALVGGTPLGGSFRAKHFSKLQAVASLVPGFAHVWTRPCALIVALVVWAPAVAAVELGEVRVARHADFTRIVFESRRLYITKSDSDQDRPN